MASDPVGAQKCFCCVLVMAEADSQRILCLFSRMLIFLAACFHGLLLWELRVFFSFLFCFSFSLPNNKSASVFSNLLEGL